MAAPEGAQRGEDAPLADRVAVGQRQRRLEIGARGLEVAEDRVHLGPGLQHLAPFDGWHAGPDRGVQRLVVARQGLGVGPCPARQRRRPARVRGGLAPRFGLEIVVSEPGGEVGEPIWVERRQRVGRPPMQGAPARRHQRGVGDVLGEGVLEDPDALLGIGALVEELQSGEVLQIGVEVLGGVRDRPQEPFRKLAAEHGRGLQEVLGRLRQSIDARGEHALHGVGHPQRRATRVAERVDQLLEEERIALGPVEDQRHERVGRGDLRQQRAHHAQTVVAPERCQRDLGRVRAVDPRRPVARSVARHQQQARTAKGLGEARQARLGGGVDPVHVLDDEHERTATAAAQPHLAQRVERARGQDLAAQRAHGLIGLLESEQAEQERGALDGVDPSVCSVARTFSAARSGVSVPAMLQTPRSRSRIGRYGIVLPYERQRPSSHVSLLADVRPHFQEQTRLAHPRLADHTRHAAVTLGDLADELAQGGRLALAPDEAAPHAAPARRVGADCGGTDEPERGDRPAEAAHVECPERFQCDVVFDQAGRGLAHEDRARGGALLAAAPPDACSRRRRCSPFSSCHRWRRPRRARC